MEKKEFDEVKFRELLRNPSTLNSEAIRLTEVGVLPKRVKE